MDDSRNPFAVLGVAEIATAEEIEAAYRARAKVLHPDGLVGASEQDRAAAEAAMTTLDLAHQLLSDEVTRKQYRRAQRKRRLAAARRGQKLARRGSRDVVIDLTAPAPVPVSVHFSGTYREEAPVGIAVDDRSAGTPWVAPRRTRGLRRHR